MPDVPTVAEQGYPNFATTSWWAVVAPAGTPADTLQKLHATIDKVLLRPATQERIRQIGADITSMSLDESQAYTAQELDNWKTTADPAKVKINRTDEPRVGKECGSTSKSQWAPYQ